MTAFGRTSEFTSKAAFSGPFVNTSPIFTIREVGPIVYAKAAFGGPLQVLRYLGRYTHRVAISNHRLLSFDGECVTFRWRDYAHGYKSLVMTLDAVEFLRRFFLHILPMGFVRIRHFGFLANRFRTARLALCRQLLACEVPEPPPMAPASPRTWQCPRCGSPMVLLARLTAQDLSSRCTQLLSPASPRCDIFDQA